MAKSSNDYFGLGRLVSIILAIIPITSWICGIITRIQDGHIVAGIIRIFLGWLTWIIDLVLIIINGKILRLLNV